MLVWNEPEGQMGYIPTGLCRHRNAERLWRRLRSGKRHQQREEQAHGWCAVPVLDPQVGPLREEKQRGGLGGGVTRCQLRPRHIRTRVMRGGWYDGWWERG